MNINKKNAGTRKTTRMPACLYGSENFLKPILTFSKLPIRQFVAKE
jgi:hypothetical protein